MSDQGLVLRFMTPLTLMPNKEAIEATYTSGEMSTDLMIANAMIQALAFLKVPIATHSLPIVCSGQGTITLVTISARPSKW